ncbi:MAG: GTP 3',8-cyclase MoaA [Nitrospirae bacterium]|nr:GTP 3',8-cyclase MoaA [Nitrospirota bacterium]
MAGLKDKFERTIDYIRISITDRCNLRCIYCISPEGFSHIGHKAILTYEEISRVVGIASGLGVRKVRITGGEPLIRKDITLLAALIKKIPGIEDLSITTNGILLERYAEELAKAGVDRVNVSLDSLRPERYGKITNGGDIGHVLRGIEAAEKTGLIPIKINVVPIRGINDDEIRDFAEITLNSPYHIRFIEFMPYGSGLWSPRKYIPCDEIKSTVETIGPLLPVRIRKNGPSRYFRLKNSQGVIGFISAVTHHFCEDCNRLRMTADGKLRPCLFSETKIDLKPAIRDNSSDDEIKRLLELAVAVKPRGHNINDGGDLKLFQSMSQIGG